MQLDVSEDRVRTIKGAFRLHKSYYYCKETSANLAASVSSKFPDATILEHGNHRHAFVGGAASGSAKDSFIWVTFTLSPAQTTQAVN